MAKIKAARSKKKAPAAPSQGIACLVLLGLLFFGVLIFIYLSLKHAN